MFMISNFKLQKRSFKDMNIVKICFDSMHSQFEKEMGIGWRQRFNKPSPRNKRDYGPENVSWRNRIRERKRQTCIWKEEWVRVGVLWGPSQAHPDFTIPPVLSVLFLSISSVQRCGLVFHRSLEPWPSVSWITVINFRLSVNKAKSNLL